MKRHHFLPLTTALLTIPCQAAITYVDAVDGAAGNTFATGSTLADTSWYVTTTATNDTSWSKRTETTNETNGDTVFQALVNDDTNTIPELTTRISGLANGTYTIWAFYWDQIENTSQNWVLSAGLSSGSLTTYSSMLTDQDVANSTESGIDAGTLSFTTAVRNFTTPRRMFGVNLGNVSVAGGTVDVFIDNSLVGATTNNRAWYDGVGYELVPEPSVALLGGIGFMVMLRRRR